MYTLYIDTHYVDIVLGLFLDDKLIDKVSLLSDKHSTNTISLIEELLNNNKISVDNIDTIIVINGPGSFTGVRIGVVIAKVIAYTKNIKLKALSYLEALALNYDEDVVVGVQDKNGVFGGEFRKDKSLVGDYFYLKNKEIDSYDKNILVSDKVDLNKVYNYMKGKEVVNPHILAPLYVKKIEVE